MILKVGSTAWRWYYRLGKFKMPAVKTRLCMTSNRIHSLLTSKQNISHSDEHSKFLIFVHLMSIITYKQRKEGKKYFETSNYMNKQKNEWKSNFHVFLFAKTFWGNSDTWWQPKRFFWLKNICCSLISHQRLLQFLIKMAHVEFNENFSINNRMAGIFTNNFSKLKVSCELVLICFHVDEEIGMRRIVWRKLDWIPYWTTLCHPQGILWYFWHQFSLLYRFAVW